MPKAAPSLVVDVLIYGPGFSITVTLGTFQAATELVTHLYHLRDRDISKPHVCYDDDGKLVAFVVPTLIAACTCQMRDANASQVTGEYMKAQLQLAETSVRFMEWQMKPGFK